MIAQAQKQENKRLNDREQTFCKLMVPGTKTATQAYIDAGYCEAGASANSSRLIAKDKIKAEIRRLRVELADKEGITQGIQCKKLEDLRLRCKDNDDSTGENAAIREQNKLFGLSIDKSQTEQTAAQEARSAAQVAEDKRYAQWCLLQSKLAEQPTEVVIDGI